MPAIDVGLETMCSQRKNTRGSRCSAAEETKEQQFFAACSLHVMLVALSFLPSSAISARDVLSALVTKHDTSGLSSFWTDAKRYFDEKILQEIDFSRNQL